MRRSQPEGKEMIRKVLSVACLTGVLLAGCNSNTGGGDPLAYCEDNDGTLETRTDAAGTEFQMCVLEDGTECVPQMYMDGTCPGEDEE
jgi:putative hemolysin